MLVTCHPRLDKKPPSRRARRVRAAPAGTRSARRRRAPPVPRPASQSAPAARPRLSRGVPTVDCRIIVYQVTFIRRSQKMKLFAAVFTAPPDGYMNWYKKWYQVWVQDPVPNLSRSFWPPLHRTPLTSSHLPSPVNSCELYACD